LKKKIMRTVRVGEYNLVRNYYPNTKLLKSNVIDKVLHVF
jgi:hypothetical protein